MKLVTMAVLCLSLAVPAGAQERAFGATPAVASPEPPALSTARELYASARYEEALALLDRLRGGPPGAPPEVTAIEQYRAFCLLALGREEEAASALTAVVIADPFSMPSAEEVAPRIRSLFSELRERLLPEIAVERYAGAKASYDGKAYADAERQFREVVTLLDDPQMHGRLPDLRLLASGFLELAAAAAAPPPEPVAEPEPEAAEPPAPPVRHVYAAGDPGVTAPVAIRQELPPVPTALVAAAKPQGLLEIVIDEQGRVISFVLRTGVHAVYDAMLLNAVRDWKYRPAEVNGAPVQFRKLIQFHVRR